MYMVQWPIHRNRKVVIHHQEPYESHEVAPSWNLGLLLYEEFYIHYTKLSFTSKAHILFALLKEHPRLACGPRDAAPATPLLSGPAEHHALYFTEDDHKVSNGYSSKETIR